MLSLLSYTAIEGVMYRETTCQLYILYISDSQTVCRGTLVRRERFSSVPRNFLENMSFR